MPKASKESAFEHETVEGYEGHFEHLDGGWTVGFETYTQDADLVQLFEGLPDDRCQQRKGSPRAKPPMSSRVPAKDATWAICPSARNRSAMPR